MTRPLTFVAASWRPSILAVTICLALPGIAVGSTHPKDTVAQSSPTGTASIVGGTLGTAKRDPWLAFIEHRGESGDYTCTGTVIAPRLVLTAGHCILTEDGGLATAAGYLVATGVTDIRTAQPGNVSKVSERLLFPGYVPAENLGDAGLLVLSSPISTPPIPLASSSDGGALKPGTAIEVAGWGLTNGAAEQVPPTLRRAETTIQTAEYCREASAAFLPVYDPARQTCAIEPPGYTVGTCHGDSGGPAIAHHADGSAVQVGIIDLGDPDCSTELPNVFVRVDRILPWVESWINAVELGAPPPSIAVPKIVIPSLSIPDAKQLASFALAEDESFGERFEQGKQVHFQCKRLRKERVTCTVSWYQGPDDFYGTITAFIAAYTSGEGIFAGAHYKIHSVEDKCVRQLRQCPITTASN